MQDLPYRQEVLLYQKFVIENKSEKERTEKRKTMTNTLQEQIEMEEEVRESIKKMYPSDPDHLYRKMALEFYSCDFEKKELTFRWITLFSITTIQITLYGHKRQTIFPISLLPNYPIHGQSVLHLFF